MKKAFLRLFSIVVMLAMVIPTFSFAEASAVDNKNAVYTFLTDEIGFNSAAACGIMANIEHESNFNPQTVIRDSNGRPSGGLCMWNGSRFRNLQNFCSSRGLGSLTVNGQLSFLKKELSQNGFKHIFNYLKKVPDTAQGAYNAAYYWCYYFEIPANRSSKSVSRGNLAKNGYWAKYGKKKTPALKLTSPQNGKTLDIDSSVSLKLSGGSPSAVSYSLSLKKKGEKKALKTVKLSAKQKSYKLGLKGLSAGKYTLSAAAKSENGKTLGSQSSIGFTVKCLSHSLKSSVAKKPTQNKNGVLTHTCVKCGAVTKEVIPSFSALEFADETISSLKVSSAGKNSVTLRWSKVKNADGYAVYKIVGGKRILVKNVDKSASSAAVDSLKAGKVYKLQVRAFNKCKDKKIFSKLKTVTAATKTTSPELTGISRPGKGSVILKWNKVPGADGYVIYTSPTSGGEYKKLAVADGNKAAAKLTRLKRTRLAYFKIKAVNKASNAVYSDFSGTAYTFIK